jgi:C-terminal processing protease CtpA/Prc
MWPAFVLESVLIEISVKKIAFLGTLFFSFLGGCMNPSDNASEPIVEINQTSEQYIQPEVQARRMLVRSALSKLKEQSLFSEDVDWGSIEDELEKQIAIIQTDEDMKAPLNTALNFLRDPHARYFYKGQMFAHFTDWGNERNRDNRPIDQDARRRFEEEHIHQFELLDNQTGYIKIVGISPSDDVMQQANHIRSNLEKLAAKGARYWILDLRYNTGGNMNPMMSGLRPLLCDGAVGGEANLKGEIIGSWSMKDGDFYMGDYNDVSLAVSDGIQCDSGVAVLISRQTTSSGEAVGTTFKGRPNSRFFGENTGGLTTVTNWEPIDDELTMSIAVSYYADRNGNIFEENLQPDEHIEFVPELALNQDPAIEAAQSWLAGRIAE